MAASEMTIEHYQRPEVKATILAYCMNSGAGSRALNADEHWYRSGPDPKTVMLRGPADYEDTITKGRTLYATLDILDQSVFEQSSPWSEEKHAPETPIGDLSHCLAFTLSTDIDGIGDIRKDLSVKEAVEAAAQFHVDYLRERGITNNIYCLYSGGGIYVHLHHALFVVDVENTELTPDEIKRQYQIVTKAYNSLIGDISAAFFRKYPQYINRVKFDQLNNQKRTYKVVLSLHKRHPFAVIPLNPAAIKIDFKRASLPISDEVLAECAAWYKSYDPSEKKAVVALLKDKMAEVEQIIRDRPTEGNSTISRLPEPLDRASFAPCIKNIIEKAEDHEGKHRGLGILATYLYQMGWSEDAAFDLWAEVANRCRVEPRIFDTTWGRVSCPLCSTIQTDTGGYPHLNLFKMGFCVPDGHCKGCQWPGDYHNQKILNEQEQPKGPTVLDAFKAILVHEAEAEKDKDFNRWNWRMQKNRIERAVKSREISKSAEEKAYKFLKQYRDTLKKYGIDYDDLYPLIRKPKSTKEEFSLAIKAKALEILKTGDPSQYIVDSCSETVKGAEKAIKKLCCCVSVQNIRQSAGLHPKLNGDSSGGKTFTVYTFAHHMPKEAVIKGSMSAKAGFYHDDGNRVFRILDDYQAGNEDLDTTIKQTSSEFHASYQHRTVANHAAVLMEIGSEQTWAITSVDSSQEIQVLNRQLPINIDDSATLTAEVNKLTIERYSSGGLQFPISENVLVSRCILQILRDEGYIDVRIPFGDRINWIDTSNRRNPSMFMDLLIAFTAMNRYQREKDSDGYYLATEADFQAAKELFTDNDAEELVKRLTKKERETLEFMLSKAEGITQDELAEHLKVSRQRAGQILYGQKGAGGLVGKIPIKETKLSEMVRISDDERRTIHKTVYSLTEYNKLADFEAVVKLDPKPTSEEPRKSCKYGASKDASMNTASSKEDESIESKKEKEREEERIEDLRSPPVDESISLSENQNHTCNTCVISTDSDAHTCDISSEDLRDLRDVQTGTGPHHRAEEATNLEKLRIIKQDGYRTQIPSPDDPNKFIDHLFNCGDVAEFQHWKAVDLIKQGVAEAVEA